MASHVTQQLYVPMRRFTDDTNEKYAEMTSVMFRNKALASPPALPAPWVFHKKHEHTWKGMQERDEHRLGGRPLSRDEDGKRWHFQLL